MLRLKKPIMKKYLQKGTARTGFELFLQVFCAFAASHCVFPGIRSRTKVPGNRTAASSAKIRRIPNRHLAPAQKIKTALVCN